MEQLELNIVRNQEIMEQFQRNVWSKNKGYTSGKESERGCLGERGEKKTDQ